MEETLRDVVTRIGNGREVLRAVLKLSDGNEVIECSDGSRIVMHSGGEKYAEWISAPNRLRRQLFDLYEIAFDALEMAAVLGDRAVNDDASEKIGNGLPYYVDSHEKLQDAVALMKDNLEKARGAMYVMTGIITEVDGETEKPEE